MPTQRLTDLAAIEAALWHELETCVRHKKHGWRIGVLATRDGEAADARSVVLREASRERRELLFFADSRSPKVRQAQAHGGAGKLVLWSNELSWQLRLDVQLEVATAGLAVSSRWARLKMKPGAQDYLSPLPPGTPLTPDAPAASPLPERGTREHFAVVTARVLTVDWLELHAEGHRRAAFDVGGARWLVP